jgi:hypothetical protein
MKELKIEIPEGYEIDKEKSSFEKIVFKKKVVVNCWEDLKHASGVYIDEDSRLDSAPAGLVLPHNKNVFLNEKYAKSALALAQISQLLPYYDTNVDWESEDVKHCITRSKNNIVIGEWVQRYCILAFNRKYEAERFLKHNEQLVKDFYML